MRGDAEAETGGPGPNQSAKATTVQHGELNTHERRTANAVGNLLSARDCMYFYTVHTSHERARDVLLLGKPTL